jgi:hypothetical protein
VGDQDGEEVAESGMVGIGCEMEGLYWRGVVDNIKE